jgi:hypothetical protein
MKLHRIVILIIACIPVLASAQDYAFKVLVNKGKNEVKSTTGWQQIKVGASLKSADELKVAENSYIGLVHVTGKALELKQSGNYKITDLAAKVNGGSSVLNKYTDFILSQNTVKKNNLTATGAVHRGLGIKVFLPPSEAAVVYGNVVNLNWDSKKHPAPYVVKLKSVFGDELDVVETKENMIRVDLYSPKLKNEDNIIVEVTSKQGNASNPDTYVLKKLSTADKDRIKGSLRELESATTEKTALNQLYLAGFFESNKLLIDASTAYQEAIALAPDVPYYKETYEQFLLKNGLKDPEKKYPDHALRRNGKIMYSDFPVLIL